MLYRDESEFAFGAVKFLDESPNTPRPNAKVFVSVEFSGDGLEIPVLCLLDTGADWSVLNWEVAQMLGCHKHPPLDEIKYDTRHGTIKGELVRVPYRIRASKGRNLEGEATFFVSEDWPMNEASVLGYNGFLQHLNFALSPTENQFYFGHAG